VDDDAAAGLQRGAPEPALLRRTTVRTNALLPNLWPGINPLNVAGAAPRRQSTGKLLPKVTTAITGIFFA